MGFVLEAFQKLSIKVNNLVDLKHEQEKEVNCLLEGRDFAVMPTVYGKSFIFQLFATAMTIKKVCEGQHLFIAYFYVTKETEQVPYFSSTWINNSTRQAR